MRVIPLLCLTSFCVQAAETKLPEELGEIIVEAMKPGIANRIDSEEVRDFTRRDLADALTLLPGVSLQRTGNRAETMVTVRGFDLRQVPVFIDGIPVYVPYDGYADLGRFTVPGSGELEVAKGISPVLAGPNALGGLINVVTRRPEKRLEGSIFGGAFTGGGEEAGLTAGGREAKGYWQFDLSWLKQDAMKLSDDFESVPVEDGGYRKNSGHEDWRASGRVGFTPSVDDEYVFGFWIQRGEKDNPVYTGTLNTKRYWQWPKWDKDTYYILTKTALNPDTTLETNVHYDRFENILNAYDDASYTSQSKPSSFTSFYDDWTAGGSAKIENRSFKDLRLAAAVHYKRDHHEQMDRGFPTYTFEDETVSLGIEAERQFAYGNSANLGISRDWRKVRKAVDTNNGGAPLGGDTVDSWNPQLILKHEFSENLEGHLGFAQKSRFPTIKDRYSYRMGQAISNPDLEPETAEHIDLGFTGSTKDGIYDWAAGVFFSRIDDAIQRVDRVAFTPLGAPLFQLQNVGEVEHKGFELAANAKWTETIETGVRYAYTDAKNRTNPAIKVFGTPENEVLLFAKLKLHENFRLIPAYTLTDGRDVTSTGVRVGKYERLDLRAELTLPAETTLSFGVTNLLDRNQELDEGYPEEGRSYFVNLRHEF